MPTPNTADAWLSVHVHYPGNPDPLLREAVAPLVRRLRGRGLIAGWFFIRYWVEGDHIRLRLRPVAGATDLVRRLTTRWLTVYLAENPSPDTAPGEPPNQAANRAMFAAEYGDDAWDRAYGSTGMPRRPTNRWYPAGYFPEYDRYGGADGIEIAEWHFERSSDIVLGLIAGHPAKSARLGLSAKLSMILCTAFLSDTTELTGFLTGYRDSWEPPSARARLHEMYDASYARSSDRLRRLVTESPQWTEWSAHCHELSERACGSVALLRSYLHMTNNRLGVHPVDEAYVAHLIAAALTDSERERHVC
ncbi:thiopeptide-type bacteriocin biosynthesis protein [Amycolatopsis sp. cg5]|uniref:thiopeptide-type bacteriocin biosynthesis protein n=1 Tax=Amycolatopsis sp. cg5 TaxID=3238802 RepID=UPI0035240F1B